MENKHKFFALGFVLGFVIPFLENAIMVESPDLTSLKGDSFRRKCLAIRLSLSGRSIYLYFVF